VHVGKFELYRLLKNCLASGRFYNIEVEPERAAGSRCADLVLMCKEDGEDKHLLVIEVKGRIRELSVYDDKARQQAKAYADYLKADYYAVTNGYIIRLFKKPDKHMGDYYFELTEEKVERFLNDLFSIIAGEGTELSLPQAPSMDEFVGSTSEFANAVREVLEELGGQRDFSLETEVKEKTRMFYLSVGKFKRVFRLGIPLQFALGNKPYVDIRLNALKRKLDTTTVEKLLNKFSLIL